MLASHDLSFYKNRYPFSIPASSCAAPLLLELLFRGTSDPGSRAHAHRRNLTRSTSLLGGDLLMWRTHLSKPLRTHDTIRRKTSKLRLFVERLEARDQPANTTSVAVTTSLINPGPSGVSVSLTAQVSNAAGMP